MSVNKSLATISDRKMDRKDFLKLMIFLIASMIGLKNLLTLMTDTELRSDMTLGKVAKQGGGYNGGRYNR